MPEIVNDHLEVLGRAIYNTGYLCVKALEQVAREQERLQESLHIITEPVLQAQRIIEQKLAPVARQLAALQQQVEPFLVKIQVALESLPQRSQESLRILAQNGWYPDPHLLPSDLFELSTLFVSGEVSQAHKQLCDHFDSRCVDIEAVLCKRCPRRAKLLKSAFGAHRRGEYALAIPVFLAQADGMCQEITGVQLYGRREGVPRLASDLFLREASEITRWLLTPLIEPMPISASSSERAGLTDALNRHAVLHGESVDYDSSLNSYRAISLLVYVSWVLGIGPTSVSPERRID